MTDAELLSQTRKHLWAAWALSSDEIGSVAVDTLIGLGMLVPEGGAQEMERLRQRVLELEQLLVEDRPADGDPIPVVLTPKAECGRALSTGQPCPEHDALTKQVAELEHGYADHGGWSL